jgi:hypothetical protein
LGFVEGELLWRYHLGTALSLFYYSDVLTISFSHRSLHPCSSCKWWAVPFSRFPNNCSHRPPHHTHLTSQPTIHKNFRPKSTSNIKRHYFISAPPLTHHTKKTSSAVLESSPLCSTHYTDSPVRCVTP